MKFIARGRVTLDGVIFTIEARDYADAWGKAMVGDYLKYDLDTAETVDWEIKANTVEEE